MLPRLVAKSITENIFNPQMIINDPHYFHPDSI